MSSTSDGSKALPTPQSPHATRASRTAATRPADLAALPKARSKRGRQKPEAIRAASQLDMPWWCLPQGLAVGFLLPLLLAIAAMRGINHPGMTVRGLIFLDARYVALGCGLIIVMALGGWFGAQLSFGRGKPEWTSQRSWDTPALVLGVIALAAYCLWFKDYVFNPVLMWQSLTGEHRPSRETITLMPGLTSLVNVSPAFFAVLAYRLFLAPPGEQAGRLLKSIGLLMGFFVIFRAYAWSERLALIEAGTPFVLAGVVRLTRGLAPPAVRRAGRSKSIAEDEPSEPSLKFVKRVALALGPFLAIPLVVGIFGLFEFFRSWTSDTYRGKTDFFDFAVGRFLSYYYTSLNNGAGLMETTNWPSYRLDYVLEWLHRAPILALNARGFDYGAEKYGTETFLSAYGDVEFNSPSGLYSAIVDLGIPLGAVYFFALGLLAGLACRAYRNGKLLGVLLYPTTVLTSMELFRYPYLGQPRAFTAVLGMAVVVLMSAVIVALEKRAQRGRR